MEKLFINENNRVVVWDYGINLAKYQDSFYITFLNLPKTPNGSLLPVVACKYNSPVSSGIAFSKLLKLFMDNRFSIIIEEKPRE